MRSTCRGPLWFALALFGLTGAYCEPPSQHVGRRCDLGTASVGVNSGESATLSSPALECPSHICLLPRAETDPRSPAQVAAGTSGTGALCTAGCESHEDCEDAERGDPTNPDDKRCRGGFACIWPTVVGGFACQRLCVCTDFVKPPPGGFTKPAACE
jgi:hypothetical protein